MATQANQQAWNTNSPAALGDTNYWQTGDIVYNNTQLATVATTATATNATNSLTVASATGIVSGQLAVGAGIPNNTIVVSVSGTTVTISQNVTKALATTPVTFLANTYPFPIGWVCTQNGYPGTWEPLPQQPMASITTTQTIGTLSGFFRVTYLNPASTGTYSLPEALNNPAGSVITIKNLASGSVTLSVLTTDSYADATAITLTQYGLISLSTQGTTVWYKVG